MRGFDLKTGSYGGFCGERNIVWDIDVEVADARVLAADLI